MSHDCWNIIGVHGDGSCPELPTHIHCHNCPVYSAAAQALLDREGVAVDIAESTRHFATPQAETDTTTDSVLIFRVAAEWLALPMAVVQEIANVRPVHSLPHRRGGTLLGVANMRGELLACVALGRVLGLENTVDAAVSGRRAAHPRLLVLRRQGFRAMCPVDEVHGLERIRAGELQAVPATVAKAAGTHSKAVIPWRGHSVGLLDDERLFATLQRSLA